jgi:SAM-dependent methyltransferase
VEEKEVECPRCRSHPRHRKLWVYLSRHTKFFKLKNLYFLHIAPEGCLKEKFKKLFDNYLTADISGHAMVQMDITDIKYPDNSFDIIMCNHVLEHIPDDIKAMSELYHVLKKGGMAILLVPMNLYSDQTYEDWSVVTPEGRVKAFGQHDHVRIYGKDYLERLQSVGFGVSAVLGNEYLSPREMKKYSGINRHDDVIVTCTK